MKPIPATSLEVGTTIKNDILNDSGNIVLAGGTTIEQRHIDYFISHGIEVIFVSGADAPEEPQEGSGLTQKYQTVKELYDDLITCTKELHYRFQDPNQSKQIDFELIISKLKPLLEMTLEDNDILRTLRNINKTGQEGYLFTHPVHVALLSGMLAKWLGYSDERILDLSICGYFHDIGKTKVDQKLFYKTESLSPEEFAAVREHAVHGYEILGEIFEKDDTETLSDELKEEMRQVALSHHERENGSGYPFGLKGDEIPESASLVAVVDVYDAVTSNRHYKDGISPYLAFRLLKEESFKGLSASMSQVFLDSISKFFINNRVKLSDGRVGSVVYVNKFALNRPLVRIGEDFVDLSTNYKVDVVDVLE